MKKISASLALLLAFPAAAELFPGDDGVIAAYKIISSNTGADLGRVYVPGAKMPGAGQDYWYWTSTPWNGKFELSYIGDVTSYTPPTGAIQEVSIGGKFDAGNLPTSSTVSYNWKVSDSTGTVAYVDRGTTSTLDWFTPTTTDYLDQNETLTFSPVSGTVSISTLQGAVGDTL